MRAPDGSAPPGIFLTAPQAARRAGKSRHTIERWARTGRVHGRLVGGRWMISAASLDRASQQ